MKPYRLLTLASVVFLCLAPSIHAKEAPWVTAAAALPIPEYAVKATAVVLLDETIVSVSEKGEMVVVKRRAIRIRHKAGSQYAACTVPYNSKSDKILSLTAWLVRPKTKTETRDTKEWIDFADENTKAIFDEERYRSARFVSEVIEGDVVAFETKVSKQCLVAQMNVSFGNTLPVLSARETVFLPPGFTLRTDRPPTRAKFEHSEADNSWTWSITNTPHRPSEPYSAASALIDESINIQIIPPTGAKGFRPRCFKSWAEICDWHINLAEGQCDASPALTAKAHELCAGRQSPLEKIRALAAYVQGLRYIALNENLLKGSGYVPRKASLVLARGYGDCKDKANLLRALLREVGIVAHPVCASTGGRDLVEPSFPSPYQFNHAITAIEVGPEVNLPSVIVSEKAGRLLIFDATDTETSVGDLPSYLQGTMILLLVPKINELACLPDIPPETGFKYTTHAELHLEPNGTAKLHAEIVAKGQCASHIRQRLRNSTTPSQLNVLALDLLGTSLQTGNVTNCILTNSPETDEVTLAIDATKQGFSQRAKDSLVIIKMDVLGRAEVPTFPEKERIAPILLSPICLEDELRFVTPPGLVVEELPRTCSIESKYGSFQLAFEQKDGAVIMQRRLLIKLCTVPAAEYAQLKAFLADIVKSDRNALLLRKTASIPPKAQSSLDSASKN